MIAAILERHPVRIVCVSVALLAGQAVWAGLRLRLFMAAELLAAMCETGAVKRNAVCSAFIGSFCVMFCRYSVG